ncbi:MAG: hypothetical protein NTV70_09245 [Acidobacteria bacterium]|nr:hypothetical protein [Acidobacteriota bacterium]
MSANPKSPAPAATPMRRLSLFERRALVVAMYGGYAAYMLLRGLAVSFDSGALGLAGIAALVGCAAAAWALLYQTPYWNWGNAPDGSLDERELAVRNRSYRVAYSAYAAITLLPVVYVSIAIDHPRLWLPRTYDEVSRIVWAMILTSGTLPSALLAWDDRPLEEDREV